MAEQTENTKQTKNSDESPFLDCLKAWSIRTFWLAMVAFAAGGSGGGMSAAVQDAARVVCDQLPHLAWNGTSYLLGLS